MKRATERVATTPAPSPIDQCTVDDVLAYLGTTTNPTSSSDSGNIQLCITSASKYWLWRTGNEPADGSTPTESPLVEVVAYDEFYDGQGGLRQFTRHRPIVSVSLVQIGLVTIPQSQQIGQPGWLIDSSGRCITLRNAAGGNLNPSQRLTVGFQSNYGGYRFFSDSNNPQNVRITYMAGYNGTPPDVFEKTIKMVAINYKRKGWLDQASQAMAEGAGTITFRSWDLSPDIENVIREYSRKALTA